MAKSEAERLEKKMKDLSQKNDDAGELAKSILIVDGAAKKDRARIRELERAVKFLLRKLNLTLPPADRIS